MPESPRIVIILASLTLLTGCGPGFFSSDNSVLTNGDYWREFFGPGIPGHNAGVPVATTPDRTSPGQTSSAAPAAVTGASTQVNDNAVLLQQLFRQAGGYVDDFLNVEERHHAVTVKLEKDLDRAIAQAGKVPDAEARRRIADIISRAGTALEDQHSKVEFAQTLFNDKAKAIMADAVEIESVCASANRSAELATACPRFQEVLSLTRVKLEILTSGFAHTTGVYQDERKAQGIVAQKFRPRT